MWKNTVQLDRPQITIWSMNTASWIPTATNTHSEYVLLIALPVLHLLHKRTSMLSYTYTACLVPFYEHLFKC